MMKISVIMIDGGFRENVYGAKYFSEQDLAENEYEIIWVDYYDKPHKNIKKYPKVNVIALNKTDEYHSSYCFNAAIAASKGELVVIPDADVVVEKNFLERVWEDHQANDSLVMYCYRYDEPRKEHLLQLDIEHLRKECVLTNPSNYGGCLTVRKKWLLEINGYEQHPIFRSGFHANGLDVYTRLKNLGLHIKWHPTIKLFHPWHSFTLEHHSNYKRQHDIIRYRSLNFATLPFCGLDPNKNFDMPADLSSQLQVAAEKDINRSRSEPQFMKIVSRITRFSKLLHRH